MPQRTLLLLISCYAALAVVFAAAGGCGSAPLYLHDEKLASQLKAARAAFHDASEVWTTIEANSKQMEEVEIETLRSASATRRLTTVQNLGNLKWGAVKGQVEKVNTDLRASLPLLLDQTEHSVERIAVLEKAAADDPTLTATPDPRSVRAALEADPDLAGLRKALNDLNGDISKLSDYLTRVKDFLAKVEQAGKGLAKLQERANDPTLAKLVRLLRSASDPKVVERLAAGLKDVQDDVSDPGSITLPAKVTGQLNDFLAPVVVIFADFKSAVAGTSRSGALTPALNAAVRQYLGLDADVATVDDLKKVVAAADKKDGDPLPQDLKQELRLFLGPRIVTVDDLIKVVVAPDSGIHEIRLSLELESRRTAAELARASLESEKAFLDLCHTRLAVLAAKRKAAELVFVGAPAGNKQVAASFDVLFGEYEAAVAAKDAQRVADARTKTKAQVEALTAYVSLIGSLNRWDRITKQQVVIAKHRGAIAHDRAAIAAYDRLIIGGMNGAIRFAEGGITQEEIANWINVVQTVGIGIISGK